MNAQTAKQWAIEQAKAHYIYLGSIVPTDLPKHERSTLESDFFAAQRRYYSLVEVAI